MTSSRWPQALRKRATAPVLLAALGLLLAVVAALDPYRLVPRLLGPLLAVVGLAYARVRQGAWPRPLVVSATLALALAIGASSPTQFLRADFPQYFAYLRSMAFDRDLDFADEWAYWGFAE